MKYLLSDIFITDGWRSQIFTNSEEKMCRKVAENRFHGYRGNGQSRKGTQRVYGHNSKILAKSETMQAAHLWEFLVLTWSKNRSTEGCSKLKTQTRIALKHQLLYESEQQLTVMNRHIIH